MARRRQGFVADVLDELVKLPWWASAFLAVVGYLLLPAGAWFFALVFIPPAAISAIRAYRRRKLFDSQADIASIRSLTWQDFEKLIAEWFSRIGYTVTEQGGASPDGGIDLVATALNEKLLVQCKHWRARMVGVSIVRELYGVMTAERATGGALVTSGAFSADALAFAAGKPIQMIDGRKLEELVLAVRSGKTVVTAHAAPEPQIMCPSCGAPMVTRTARRGPYAGSSFWGCSRYPTCRGVRSAA